MIDEEELRKVELSVQRWGPDLTIANIYLSSPYGHCYFVDEYDPDIHGTEEEAAKYRMPEFPDQTYRAAAAHFQGILARVAAIAHQWMEPKTGHAWEPELRGNPIRPGHRKCGDHCMTVYGMEQFGRDGLSETYVRFQVPARELDEWIDRISSWVRQVVTAATQLEESD